MNNAATVDEKRADFYGRASIWNRNDFLDITSCAVFTEKTSSKSNKNYMDGEEQTQ